MSAHPLKGNYWATIVIGLILSQSSHIFQFGYSDNISTFATDFDFKHRKQAPTLL